MKKIISMFLVVIFLTSCTTNLGDFTIISTNNVPGVDVSAKSVDVEGRSCVYFVLFIPFGNLNGRIKEATRNAIAEGRKNFPAGDSLVNAVVDDKVFTLGIAARQCIVVRGQLVKLIN